MDIITKYQKLNAILRKLPHARIEVQATEAKTHYPKTSAAFFAAGAKAGLPWSVPCFTYEAGTFGLTGFVNQTDGCGRPIRTVEVNDFATLTFPSDSGVDNPSKDVRTFAFDLTDEFIEVGYVAAKKLYAEQIKQKILQEMVEARLKEEGFV